MLMRKAGRVAMGILLIAALGCKSHPELSKTNDKGSSEWKHSGGSGTLSIFTIKAGNFINTPAGDKLMELDLSCDGFHKSFDIQTASFVEPDSGAVNIGTSDGSLSSKTWETNSAELRSGRAYTMKPAAADRSDVLGQIKHGSEFLFEFTPKGGKAQRSKFTLSNINSLLDQDQNCKEAIASLK